MAADQRKRLSPYWLSLDVIDFCAQECEYQQSGERSVGRMARAWNWAQQRSKKVTRVSTDDILTLGTQVDPNQNLWGFRTHNVTVRGALAGARWADIPRQLDNLVGAQRRLSPDSWFYEYENIHPFGDGNGRTGQILFNWLNGTLHSPVWAPNFWHDPRREANE